jgi:chromosomal replication initiator protein
MCSEFESGCALDDIDLNDVWTKTLESLSAGALTPQQRAFVTLTRPLGIVGDTALVAAPNEFTKDVLESRLSPIVCDALSATLGREMRLAVTVDETIAPYLDDEATDDLADSTYADIEKVG